MGITQIVLNKVLDARKGTWHILDVPKKAITRVLDIKQILKVIRQRNYYKVKEQKKKTPCSKKGTKHKARSH